MGLRRVPSGGRGKSAGECRTRANELPLWLGGVGLRSVGGRREKFGSYVCVFRQAPTAAAKGLAGGGMRGMRAQSSHCSSFKPRFQKAVDQSVPDAIMLISENIWLRVARIDAAIRCDCSVSG